MGVPGPVTSAPSEGVHELLRIGEAQLVTRAAHVLELVSPAGEHLVERPRGPERVAARLGSVQQQVLDALPAAVPAGTASVARTAGLAPEPVARALQHLEQLGLASSSEAGWRLGPAAGAAPDR
jgi:DNA processing protein